MPSTGTFVMDISENDGHYHRRTSDLDGHRVVSVHLKRSYRSYSASAALVLGALQILLGLWSLALGIAHTLVCSEVFGKVGFGIWSGVIYFIAGVLCIASYFVRSPSVIASQMVFSIIAASLSVVQLSLGVAAAYMDRYFLLYNVTYPYPYVPNMVTQTANTPYSGTVVVDSLLAVAAILEGVVAIAAASLACKVVCCNLNFVLSQQETDSPNRSYNVKERAKMYECEAVNCRKF